ncbi:putative autophagocytosis associated protein [Neospora caninum Liverpool]|uniref:Autophagocytosis associated protein, putative n=1 Tax=Neospora caninum (strain Liverpool) TaxID=572307 RepID=F0VKL2_NEOCL|nr:putative autophagocytosis associated protein [Neospora caninum Liverpool]CBZ54613.1 putative autophagocytosis associated protein [Neospora caninum Liverpool]CEL69328.1 TPA: autophagocytosis associated protein, putative [Neospora caninum Liverpool]|eukprot:XP_003884643.1 putative autophagocytosis associated protein [Neospora caninum Liverpool]
MALPQNAPAAAAGASRSPTRDSPRSQPASSVTSKNTNASGDEGVSARERTPGSSVSRRLTSLASLSGSNVTHRLADMGRHLVASFTSAPTESSFLSKGTLTPQEFVDAGDLLTHKFPTWQWSGAGPSGKRASTWLPEDKQFLITKNVPCYRRVRDMDDALNSRVGHDAEGGWTLPLLNDEEREGRVDTGEAPDLTQSMQRLRLNAECEREAEASTRKTPPSVAAHAGQETAAADRERNLRDDVPDLINFSDIDGLVQEDDDPAAAEAPSSFVRSSADAEIVAARTYDLSITYDKYFQTPRIWLFGYSENGVPLLPEEIFEDILTDYAAKTVTVDPHPCTGIPTASIHPCRHASVMKKVVDSWLESGMKPRHDLALLVLLKFVSSVIPTIEYDFTMDVDMFFHHTKEK